MRSHLTIKSVGMSLSAMLTVLYVLIILTSLILVGLLTTGSWQAVFLGIGWSYIAGFEIGFLGVVITGYSLAMVLAPIYNQVQKRKPGWLKTIARSSRTSELFPLSWQVRLLIASLLLPPVAFLLLRPLAFSGSLSVASSTHSQPVNLGPPINTAYREAEPSFTADGRTMYFNCNTGDICISHQTGTWDEGNWTSPERLGAPISTEYEEVEPVINAAGDRLYFTSIRPGGRLKGIPFLSPFMNVFQVANTLATATLGRSFFSGLGLPDIYVSYRADGAWSDPQSINEISGEPHINTPFADHCLFFSADGNEAFWTSTRPGGFGSDDIWTSRLVAGKWTKPENLGPNVNGPGIEHTSIPTPDGQGLYITSARAEGFGGEDIYITTRGADGNWSAVINLGQPVNGPGDDRCPAWTPDLNIFLFDSVREGGFGARDIWWVEFKGIPGHLLTASSDAAALDPQRLADPQTVVR